MEDDTAFANGFHQPGELGICSIPQWAQSLLFSFSHPNLPPHCCFLTASFYPIQPVSPSFRLRLYLIPSPRLSRSYCLHAGAKSHSWSGNYAIFLDFFQPGPVFLLFELRLVLLSPPGWKQEEQRAVSEQLCHNLLFTLAKYPQNTGELWHSV